MQQKINYKWILLGVFFWSSIGILNAATIEGRVIDSYNHAGVAGATVFFDNQNNYAITDAQGIFKFSDLPVGEYSIRAKSIDYHDSYSQTLIIKTINDHISFDIYLKPNTVSMQAVQITGNANKETDVSARATEKNALNVVNVISAKAIESLPDLNVADIMQRVSGVSMVKNNFGSNSQIVIRGMPSRYNSTLVDGVVMPSTSSSGRSVSLDMFGSDLVGRIEVIKSLTPDLEGDAIGGTVNIKMKQAPDSAFFKVQVGSGYNQYYFDHSFLTFNHSTVASKDFSERFGPDYLADASAFPRQNLIVKSEKALPDIALNLSAGRRFFDKKLGAMFALSAQNTAMANTYNYTDYTPDPNSNKSLANYWENEVYSKNQKRYGAYVKLDYQFNSRNQISLFSSLFQLNELRVREYADKQAENGGSNVRPIETQTETDNSGIFCTTLKGEHKLKDNLDIDWTLLYAAANSTSPDFASIEEAKLGNQPPTLNYSKPVIRNWQWDIDQNKSAYLNINYKPTIFDHIYTFKVGGMVRSKYRKNYANEYFFDSQNAGQYPNPDLLTVPLTNDQNDQQKKGNAFLNPGNYRAWEDVDAVFGMVNTTFGKIQFLIGARVEFTYMTNQHNQNNLQIPVASSTLKYYDILPSLNLTYKLTEKQNLRFSVYQAINRQDYTEVIPYADPRAGAQSGNPNLQHAYANCFDMRYELYPHPEEVFTGGVFYKKINNAIEDIVSSGSENTSFQNIAVCTNYGLELVAMKYFGNIGFSANYTYTHSEVNVPKHYFVIKNDVYDTTITRTETRTLVGQSPNLFNISASYRNARWGFKSSITYTMQGFNLVSPSASYGKDIYQANYHNLGFTIEQKIAKRLFASIKASNILNSPIARYIKDDKTQVEKAYNYQSYYFGLKISI